MKKAITFLAFTLMTSFGMAQISVDSVSSIITQTDVFQSKKNDIEEQSEGKRTLTLVYLNGIEDGQNYYKIKAWEDNGTSYVTHLHFHYYYNTEELFLFDPLKMEEVIIPY